MLRSAVIHTIHRKVGRTVFGPEDQELQHVSEQEAMPPPGHFLSPELQSDCARFLQEVRTLVQRREEEVGRVGARL
jgi:hypothetical protein